MSRARLLLIGILSVWIAGCAGFSQTTESARSFATVSDRPTPALLKLKANLDAIFDQPKYSSAFWGVRVERLNGKILYDRLGNKLFTPASNMKIYTTAAALDLLGEDFTYQTRLEAIGTIGTDGTLHGDLLIVGSGDPSLGAWHPDKERDSRQLLADWVAKVKAAGIRDITGDIIGDGRCFTDDSYSHGWNYGDLHFWYAAASSGLAIEENAFRVIIRPGHEVGDLASIELIPGTSYITLINEIRTVETGEPNTADSIPCMAEGNIRHFNGTIALDKNELNERGSVWDGACYAAHLLAEALDREGIGIKGWPVNIRTLVNPDRIDKAAPASRKILATTISPPLKELVKVVNKISHNFFADQILRTLGYLRAKKGSFHGGVGVVRNWLKDIDVPEPETLVMTDGSGLDRHDSVQPRQSCYLLRYMKNSSKTAAFEESLPVSNMDGTLSDRMKDSAAKGKVRAKTGYIGSVRCLSGYVTDADGNDLAFSMMCNHYTVPTSEVNVSQDEACHVLATFSD